MDPKSILERLRKLAASERFDLLYGPQKKMIENTMHCKILTMPIEQMKRIPDDVTSFTVTDNSQGRSYIAVLKPDFCIC